MKALFWKEWRTIQAMTLLTIVAVVVLQFIAVDREYREYFTIGIWQLYILFLGVTSFSTEQSKKNLMFLVSLTASRAAVWWVKLSLRVGVIALLLISILLWCSFEVSSILFVCTSLALFAFCFLISLSIITPETCASAAIAFEISVVLLLLEFSIPMLWKVTIWVLIAMMSIIYSYQQFCRGKYA
ncbi:hypothetical protein UABAM_01631 [Candidatus Uabimicrobium amorphum]|uniref:Uncharacterized protein n=2 Tax=Uabimicrobium amorphum TaxID=2596890 RepID=A0A5S9ILK3_UABAM|nr:hypothetical protein UABAM_01631 [Candidatus Uabimicrobium amorphum]